VLAVLGIRLTDCRVFQTQNCLVHNIAS
jgi:hypothetical protein